MPGRVQKVQPERIVDAAAVVFARKGFSSTIMADIAREAGIGKGTLYEYFRSKDDLFFAVFEQFMKDTETSAFETGRLKTLSAAKRLTVIGDAVTRSWPELKNAYSLTMEFWSAAASSRHRERFKNAFKHSYRKYRQLVAEVLQEGIETGEFRSEIAADSVAAVLVGAWDALLLQAWFDDAFDPAAAGEDFLQALLLGLMT